MVKLSDISDAAKDQDLRDRMVSAAAQLGIRDPFVWVDSHARQLAAAPIMSSNVEETVASVYAYARDTRPPAPGVNPAAVNDEYIRFAVQHVQESDSAM